MNTQNVYSTIMRKCLYAGFVAAATISGILSPAAYADDTDVFLGTASASDVNVRPNILFILDTSGSMDTKDIPDAPGMSRLDVMKDAMSDLLNSMNNVNVGLMTFNSEGGPVRYPVGYIDADADLVEAGGFNVNLPVAQSSDDAEENVDTLINPGQTKINDTFLHLTSAIGSANPTTVVISSVNDTDDAEETQSNGAMTTNSGSLDAHASIDIGMRFRTVAIPVGAAIISAELILTVDPDGTNNTMGVDNEYSTTNFIISGQAADSPTTFTGSAFNMLLRPRTLQSQIWNNVPAAENGSPVTSPNLSLIIQEIVSRPGWVSGNNMVLFLKTLDGYRDFESCRDNCALAPKLRISYTMDTTLIPKMNGFRFGEVRIPQGAEIRRAFLDFTAAATSSEPMKIAIHGEGTGNSTTFAATNNNISSRPRTSSNVGWTLHGTDTWEAGQRYSTPDIKDVVQEIVNRNDWCGGQALNLIFEQHSTTTRMIKSFDGSGFLVEAPTLHVEFDTDTQNISAPHTGCIESTTTARVISGDDDAEQQNSSVNTTSTDLELTLETSTNPDINQKVGVRFRNLNIPQGATIVRADLEFSADGTSNPATTLTIKGHKVGDSPRFTNGNNSDISNRIGTQSTTASVSWATMPAWSTNVVYAREVTTIVQEIVNQGSWAPNNGLSFLITGTATSLRRAYSFEGNAARAPRLVVKMRQNLAGIPSVSTQTVRERLIQEINSLRSVAGTPTVNVYMEALRYFRGMPLYWGRLRGAQTSDDRYGRVSHTASFGGGTLNQPGNCINTDLNNTDCVNETVLNSPVYRTPIVDACQTNYIVLLSDGFQNTYYNTDGIQSLIASAPDPFPSSCSTANGGADCGLKLAEFANKVDQSPLTGDQTITTFTIGFAFSSDFLEDMGPAGGGQYKNASSSAELISAFETFLGDILSRPSTFTAPTLTISAFNRLFNSNEIYISLFEPDRRAAWSGNIKKYFLCTPQQDEDGDCTVGQLLDANGDDAAEDGQIKSGAVSAWSGFDDGPHVELGGAGAQVPNYSARKIYTWPGSGTALVDVNTTNVTAATLGVATGSEHTDLVQWIRGQDVDDENADGSTTDQRWVFADPLHSAALTLNYGKDGTDAVTKLVVGTNDGGFRMINAHNGREEWMFLPPEMLPIQKDLRDNAGGDHLYGVDGSATAWIVDNDGDSRIERTGDVNTDDFIQVFYGQRRGGHNYYAMDISPASELTDADSVSGVVPKLLWRINDGTTGYSRLGETWSKPFITSVLVTEGGNVIRKNVVIFAGGYDPLNDFSFGTSAMGNAIYIADIATGARIWSVSGTVGGGTLVTPDMRYSIPSDVRLIDMDGNGATDRLYVGDMGGQVWRVDLTGPLTAGTNTNVVVGKLATLSNTNVVTPVLADQRRFMFRPEVALISDNTFANGAYIAVALTSGDREDPLGETAHDKAYILRDYTLGYLPDTNNNHLADSAYHTINYVGSDLVDVTNDVVTANEAALSAANAYGWYIDFKEPDPVGFVGEKGITEGQILISSNPLDPPVYTFNTYLPGINTQSSACSVSLGSNRTYFVNLLNGTGTDIIDDVTNTRSKVNESYGIASDIIIIQQEGQSTVSVGGGTADPVNTDMGDTLLPLYIIVE